MIVDVVVLVVAVVCVVDGDGAVDSGNKTII